MSPEELFRANLSLIDRAIARVSRHARLYGPDAEDFASAARLHLIENDYAVLRRFEGRCSLATYVTIVAQRFLHMERMRNWGRWHDSAAARKHGELGVRAEQLIRRDGRSIDEALALLRDLDPTLTRARLEAIVEQLPERKARLRAVETDDVEAELPPAVESAEARVVERDVRRASDRAGEVVRNVLAQLPLEDRTMVRLHFQASMTLAEIARALDVPQRPLYRRMERVLATLRDALQNAGLDRGSIEEIVGSKFTEVDVGFRTVENEARPSSIPEEGNVHDRPHR